METWRNNYPTPEQFNELQRQMTYVRFVMVKLLSYKLNIFITPKYVLTLFMFLLHGHRGPAESFRLSPFLTTTPSFTTHSNPSAYYVGSPSFAAHPDPPAYHATPSYTTLIADVQKRPTRDKKKAPALQSPYVELNSEMVARRPMKEAREELSVHQLYAAHRIPASMRLLSFPQWEITREWWGQLLGMTNSGWFDQTHIHAWILILMEYRTSTDTWTIQSPEFF